MENKLFFYSLIILILSFSICLIRMPEQLKGGVLLRLNEVEDNNSQRQDILGNRIHTLEQLHIRLNKRRVRVINEL